ncbi:type II secretion system F family protein [Kitasatospora sp. NPDC004240]
MTTRQIELAWVTALCATTLAGWYWLQRQLAGARRTRLLLAGERAGPDVGWPSTEVAGAARGRGRAGGTPAGGRWAFGIPGATPPPWLVPELLLLPAGLAAAQTTGSPVPLLAAALAVLPLRRWRLRRRTAEQARKRAEAVVELCTGLSAELRGGATPEQALHLVTARLGEDGEALRRLGAEPVARLAAGRYGADVPAAFQLLAELPGGRGASAIAACWRVSSDGGSGLAAALDRVAEALRAERALAEEIQGELAAPRTTIAVLAALPAAGLLLGVALGARPLDILLHTREGLVSLIAGAALETAGLAWTGHIVRTASRGALGDAAPEPPARTAKSADGPAGKPTGVGWRCGISRTRAGGRLPSGAFRPEVVRG